MNNEKEEQAALLRGSLLEFTRFFYKYITGRDFIISQPVGRESHQITICRELSKVLRLEHNDNLLINIEPGSGKTLLLQMFVSWAMAHYPDSNFIYISYSHDLAAKQTAFIKHLISSSIYKYLFDIELRQDSKAKDHFVTLQGGTVAAFGSSGSITGRDAGLPGLNRFSGAVIVDDAIKPDDAHSDTIRASINKNYEETIRQRPRGVNVPIIFIGQRVHEDDLAAYLINGNDIKPWRKVILKSLDEAGNALYPNVHPREQLLQLQEKSPYVFASQFQQDPLPAGGGIFKPEWFLKIEEPNILLTFITADTAETSKSYNDATVFGFWGYYEIEHFGEPTGQYALHCLDCVEIFVEPKDLKQEFIGFYTECMRHKVKPLLAAIEKKSTGVTLLSTLNDFRGLQIRDIKRTAASGSKTQRFLEIQPLIAARLITFSHDAKHYDLVVNHMSKITANNTHRRDDICDVVYDACKIALIDKTLNYNKRSTNIAATILQKQKSIFEARTALYGSNQQDDSR